MAVANHERLQTCLVLLRDGLRPYCERTWDGFYGEKWLSVVNDKLRHPDTSPSPEDLSFLLKGVNATWHDVWKHHFGPGERNWISELTRVRNDHAHNKTFSVDDTYRALDTMERLLEAFGAGEQQREVKAQRNDLMRQRYEGQASQERRKVRRATEGTPAEGLSSWRDIITPHYDVATGQFVQAEFAANLYDVWSGNAPDEYQDPISFYRRTYLTEGLRDLLTRAARRLAGTGGDPVVDLQTNFGGGKTHSLIALYHLAGEVSPAELAGVGEMLAGEGLELPEGINRAVFVGQWESPADPSVKSDGTKVNTIWGEIAYQLGGVDGYAIVKASDLAGKSPGGAKLQELLRRYGPAIILIDEWVAYARQLPPDPEQNEVLAAGDFDTQFTFAQALTEAAAAVENVVVLIALPTSDIEMGGEQGKDAWKRLRNVVGRSAAQWQPATSDESFEIVRSRLFDPIPEKHYRARDRVLEAFWQLYKDESKDFPSETKEKTYLERMRKSYPIHPELFDRLFQDWSTLDKFQRTRGALRLMAEVISNLWRNEDRNLLIMPGTLPMSHAPLVSELKRYLDDGWDPVIKGDVDGPDSLPSRLDSENKQLGRISAARRVARTIYMGSAPRPAGNRGVDVKRVVLGCVQPGEQPGKFTDALKHLSNESTHLYGEGSQYWYQLQPNVNRVATERAETISDYDADEEVGRRLQKSAGRQRYPFVSVPIFPVGPGDVDDSDEGVSLVILPIEQEHVRKDKHSPAIRAAEVILGQRSAGPRQHGNLLVFLAVVGKRVEELRQAARFYLSWKSIDDEWELLNLSSHQRNQAAAKLKDASQTVDSRINEAFQYILTPHKQAGTRKNDWQESKISRSGHGSLPERVAARLKSEEQLIDSYSGVRVRMDLDGKSGAGVSLWSSRGDKTLGELWSTYSKFTYMPRLANFGVLATAISNGTASMSWETETFAYAEARDEESETWRGIVRGAQVDNPARSGLVLRPDVVPPLAPPPPTPPTNGGNGPVGPPPPPPNGPVTLDTKPTTFYAVFNLDPVRGISQLSDIMENVSSHLDGEVTLTLELRAETPDGFDDRTRRTVEENTQQLGSPDYDFE